jgi:hypothetical protein
MKFPLLHMACNLHMCRTINPTNIISFFDRSRMTNINISHYISFVRGGSIVDIDVEYSSNDTSSTTPSSHIDHHPFQSILDLDSLAAVLRLTCEINRRLDYFQQSPSLFQKYSHSVVDQDLLSNEDPSLGVHRIPMPNIKRRQQDRHKRTVFHAKIPYSVEHAGIKRWGVDIKIFLQLLAKTYDLSKHGLSNWDHHQFEAQNKNQTIIFALALIYLDRSCSVETHRTPVQITEHLIHGVSPNPMDNLPYQYPSLMAARMSSILPSACPFIVPRTIHNLFLTAVVLACRMVRSQPLPQPPPPFLWSWWDCHLNDENEYHTTPRELENTVVDEVTKQYSIFLQQSGIQMDAVSLYRMQIAMMGALGDGGLHVEEPVLQQFLRRWKNIFGNNHSSSVNKEGPVYRQPSESAVRMTDSVSTSVEPLSSTASSFPPQDAYLKDMSDNNKQYY